MEKSRLLRVRVMRNSISEFLRLIKSVLLDQPATGSDTVGQDVLNSDGPVRAFGYGVVVFVFAGLGAWAGFAPLESAALGQGTVQVEGDSKPIQHLEGGIVSGILVSAGDFVTEGQAVLQLDTTQYNAQLRMVKGSFWAQRAALDRLISERDGLDGPEFSQWLLAVEDERALTALENERSLFSARLADRRGEVSVLEQQIAQLENQIVGITLVTEAKTEVASSLESEISDLSALLEDGYVDKQRLRELDRALAQVLGEISEFEARAASALVAIEEARLKILQFEKRFISQVVDRITTVQEELYDFEQRIVALSDMVDRATITAPVSGVVVKVEPNTRGAVVLPGQELMTIVPDNDRLMIHVQLSPMDIDRLSIGQEAEVRFAVFKDAYTISGRLVNLSADTIVDEISGQPFYEGKVMLEEADIGLLGDERLVPGMPAEVLIKTGTRTLLSYLVSPLSRMFEASLTED